MMTIYSRAVGVGVASLLLIGTAFAQSAAPTAAPTTTAPTARPPVEHSAASIACSKQADAKGLHGKERKKFRSECKKNAAPK
jgi:hypothetical protein